MIRKSRLQYIGRVATCGVDAPVSLFSLSKSLSLRALSQQFYTRLIQSLQLALLIFFRRHERERQCMGVA